MFGSASGGSAGVYLALTLTGINIRTNGVPFRSALLKAVRMIHSELPNDGMEDVPLRKKRSKYFDLKTFRKFIKRQKDTEIEEEARTIAKTYAKLPPKGWTVATFLKKIEIGDNLDEIAQGFDSWKGFVSCTPEDLKRVELLTTEQKRKLWKFLCLFNHGLWPENCYENYATNFQAAPLERENSPWTSFDDTKLLQLAKEYDVAFGDPWLYISWEMKRGADEVRERYTDIAKKPEQRASVCELVVTRSSRPLLMSRRFKLDPPFLYIVPSKENFPSPPGDVFSLPLAFKEFRNSRLFV